MKGRKSLPHRGLLLVKNSFVAIRYCNFVSTNQTVRKYNHNIFNFLYSRVKIDRCTFLNNFALHTSLLNVYACGIEVLDCTFKNNFVLRTLVVGSETSYENNFLLVNNSFFKSEYTWSSIWTERVTDILLYNSYFYHVFRVYNQPNIDIVIAKSVRIKNSVIEGKNGSLFQLDLQDNRGIYLFTLNSTFQQGNTTLVSDDSDFINKAEKDKCVINPTGGIVHEEIGYASSRYRLLTI